jgi:hypothetical protein
MKKKIIVLIIVIIAILVGGVIAFTITSEDNSDNSINTSTKNQTVENQTVKTNTTKNTTDLSIIIEIVDHPNNPTNKEIGKGDMVSTYFNSGYSGQSDITRGLFIDIFNSTNELEGLTYYHITKAVVKFKNNNSEIVYKTYTPNSGTGIKIVVPSDLTPISTTVYYKK